MARAETLLTSQTYDWLRHFYHLFFFTQKFAAPVSSWSEFRCYDAMSEMPIRTWINAADGMKINKCVCPSQKCVSHWILSSNWYAEHKRYVRCLCIGVVRELFANKSSSDNDNWRLTSVCTHLSVMSTTAEPYERASILIYFFLSQYNQRRCCHTHT